MRFEKNLHEHHLIQTLIRLMICENISATIAVSVYLPQQPPHPQNPQQPPAATAAITAPAASPAKSAAATSTLHSNHRTPSPIRSNRQTV